MMIICQICNKECNGLKGLSVHINMVHTNISKEEYTLKYFYNNMNPRCKCGCGQKTKFRKLSKYRDFITGHNSIGKNNPFYGKTHAQESINKIINSYGYKNKKSTKKRIYNKCLNCDSLIETIPSNNYRKFCNRLCYHKYKKKAIEMGTADGKMYSMNCSKGGCNSTPGWKNSNLEIKVKKILNNLNVNFIYQKRIKLINDKYVVVDFLIPDRKIVIEVNGNYWHCNPRLYSGEYFNKKMKMYAKDIWKNDENRINHIKKLGYDVNVIWETEINYNNLVNIIN